MKTKKEIKLLAKKVSNELFPEKEKAFRTSNHYDGFIDGYSQCQKDKSEKYTEDDMLKAFYAGIDSELTRGVNFETFIKKLKNGRKK